MGVGNNLSHAYGRCRRQAQMPNVIFSLILSLDFNIRCLKLWTPVDERADKIQLPSSAQALRHVSNHTDLGLSRPGLPALCNLRASRQGLAFHEVIEPSHPHSRA